MFDPLRAKTKVLFTAALAFLFGVGLASGMGWTGAGLAAPVFDGQTPVEEAKIRPALDLSEAFIEISNAVTPAVVRIEVRRPAVTASNPMELFPFFGPRTPDPDLEPDPDAPPRVSGGSGFLVSSDGYILTNDHVVGDATEITVYLQDGRTFGAELVGTDPYTDVAAIRIDAEGLPTLGFGSSEEVRVGEWVLAVGNPGYTGTALDYTVTAGIVSAKGRPLQLIQRGLRNQVGDQLAGYAIEDFIQTDAAVNPGNSGGPLVNLRGEVIAINSAIASSTGYYQGYSFAIPIDLAARVLEDLVEYGQVRRPRLGVTITEVDALTAEAFGLPKVTGVWIQDVAPDGPAVGRLESDDIVVEIDGKPVTRVGQLQKEVAMRHPGEEVTLTIYRDGREREVAIQLGEAELTPQAPEPEPDVVADRPEEKLGIGVSQMTEELAQRAGFATAEGVIITEVRPDGPAYRRGVPQGARILALDGITVSEVEDIGEILENVESGSAVPMRVQLPDGSERTYVVRIAG